VAACGSKQSIRSRGHARRSEPHGAVMGGVVSNSEVGPKRGSRKYRLNAKIGASGFHPCR
jgi:hypothetical protein